MKRYITSADFLDLYLHAKWSKFGKVLNFLHVSNTKRTLGRWNNNYNLLINWYNIPAVIERINYKITGDKSVEYNEAIVNKYFKDAVDLKLISPGCGGGDKEFKFARFQQFSQIDGFDITPNRIDIANQRAKEKGYSNTHFFVSDIFNINVQNNHYNIFLFDSCLHHFTNLPKIMETVCECLKDDGFLVILEYTGPDRYQYTDYNINKANQALQIIPKQYRTYLQSSLIKNSVQAPGYWRMYLSDPSEGVQAGQIIGAVNQYFDVVEETKIGGDLIALVLKGIAHHFVDNPETLPILEEIFAFEDNYLETIPVANYTYGIYRKKN